MRTITIPLDEYTKEIQVLKKEIEDKAHRLDTMRDQLQDFVSVITGKNGTLGLLSSGCRNMSKIQAMKFVSQTIENTVGWYDS